MAAQKVRLTALRCFSGSRHTYVPGIKTAFICIFAQALYYQEDRDEKALHFKTHIYNKLNQ